MINFNSTTVGKVMYEDAPVKKIIQDGVVLWNSAYHYDVTSVALITSQSISDSNPQDMRWLPDGLRYWQVDASGDDIREYNVSTAYDLSSTVTAGDILDVSGEDITMTGLAWNPDGTEFSTCGYNDRQIYHYKITGSAWDLSTASASYASPAFTYRLYAIEWNNDGTIFWLNENADRIKSYSVSTPYDVSTYNSTHIDEWLTPTGYKFSGFNWNADGTQMICNDETGERLVSFDFSGSFEILSNHNQTDQSLTSFGTLTAAVTQARIDNNKFGKVWIGGGTSPRHWYEFTIAEE